METAISIALCIMSHRDPQGPPPRTSDRRLTVDKARTGEPHSLEKHSGPLGSIGSLGNRLGDHAVSHLSKPNKGSH